MEAASTDIASEITPQHALEPDTAFRPQTYEDFAGQEGVKANLQVYVRSARARGAALDHVLLFGPPGLGKTTLAKITANELAVGFRSTSGPTLSRAGDLAAILMNLGSHDVLFIDEIHRLSPTIAELLYSAMEDRALDLVVGKGRLARAIRIDLEPFTLIGATTRPGQLLAPLRDRFGILLRLELYAEEELVQIIVRAANRLDARISHSAALEIARCARGTPRIAGRLLRRVWDFVLARDESEIDLRETKIALGRLGVDQNGLDETDRRYLVALAGAGRPMGVEAMAHAISEDRETLEDMIEPFLAQRGFIQRTPQGRLVTPAGIRALG